MGEIERKFLVESMPPGAGGATVIEQGYLALDERGEVRLRRAGGKLLLTAKSGHGEVREEVEVPVEPRAFEALWPLTAGRRVRKVRHYVPLREELRAEIDIYGDALDGLRTAEVEFSSREQADRFVPPPWLGAELTGDRRYANQTLATEGLPGATAKRAYALRATEDAAAGLRRVIVGRLDKAVERLRLAGAGGDAHAAAIHGARKDLKKARAALRLARGALGEKAFKRENGALRDAGRLLALSRDAEVKLATLAALVGAAGGEAPAGAAVRWRAALGADRDRILAAEAVGTEEAAAAIKAIADRVPEWELDRDGWELLGPGLDTAYRAGRGAFAVLDGAPDFDAVHELRKRAKDLWYQVRLLGDIWPRPLAATAAEIHDFTDRLGDHHDLAVLAADLDRRPDLEPDRQALHALIEARQESLLADALAAGRRIYAEKPKPFERRLHAYWRASRGAA